MSRDAIIAGASGLVGSACLDLLLDRYESVTSLVRRSSGIHHPRLTERQIDFEKLGSIEIPRGAHVYSALGTTIKRAGSEAAFRKVDFEYPRWLAQRAAAAGDAKYMLVSSVGADPRSANFYLRVKGELEDAIRALPLAAFHTFRPSFLMGNRVESRPAERVGIAVARATQWLLVGSLRKYRPIRAALVARAMVHAANSSRTGVLIYHYDEMREL